MSTLYFIAIVPSEPVYSEVFSFKQEIAEKYNSSRSLKNPPHITLLPPTSGNDNWEKNTIEVLQHFAMNNTSFPLVLNGFASFPNRRRKNPVIYVHNEEEPLLEALFKRLIEELIEQKVITANQYPQRFTPHMTIGYRDLTLEEYDKAWEEFSKRQYKTMFIVNAISFLKHDKREGKWNVLEEFPFRS